MLEYYNGYSNCFIESLASDIDEVIYHHKYNNSELIFQGTEKEYNIYLMGLELLK